MANLEETQEHELDSILTELSLLEQKGGELRQGSTQTHSRSSSIVSGAISTVSSTATSTDMRESSRTESPDNDSAFSDTVSLLSSESSASSGLSSLNNITKIPTQPSVVQVRWVTKNYRTTFSYIIPFVSGCEVDEDTARPSETRTRFGSPTLRQGILRRRFVKVPAGRRTDELWICHKTISRYFVGNWHVREFLSNLCHRLQTKTTSTWRSLGVWLSICRSSTSSDCTRTTNCWSRTFSRGATIQRIECCSLNAPTECPSSWHPRSICPPLKWPRAHSTTKSQGNFREFSCCRKKFANNRPFVCPF